jgi:hypothetical protein
MGKGKGIRREMKMTGKEERIKREEDWKLERQGRRRNMEGRGEGS